MSSSEPLIRLPWWAWALVNWFLVLILTIVMVLAAGKKRWPVPHDTRDVSTLTKDDCNDDHLRAMGNLLTLLRKDQCEQVHFDSVILERQNTWSNFAYLAAGLFILYRRPGLLGIAAGVNLILLFLFSGWYHASLNGFTQAFDVGWIFAVIISLHAYALEAFVVRYGDRHLRLPITIPLAIGPTLFGFIVSILKYNDNWHVDSTMFTLVLLGILLVPVTVILLDFWWLKLFPKTLQKNLLGRDRLGTRQRLLFTCYAVMPTLMCAICKFTDGCGNPQCVSTAPVQAHALWHILGAVALAMTFNLLAEAGDSREAILPL